jgi:hypothetical protein
MLWVPDLFFIRARMGPFHPRADGTRSHPRGASHLATTQKTLSPKENL